MGKIYDKRKSDLLHKGVRAGTEWRAGHWYFRGGWGIWPDPYSTSDTRHGTALQVFAVVFIPFYHLDGQVQ